MQQNRSSGGFHPHFSTWLATSDQLERTLVGHHEILRDFLARLRGVEQGSPANHFLLVGPRGIGKTHVICLGGHYVTGRAQKPKDWPGPSSAWVCVLFAEEEYAGQNSLANFLLTLFTKLHEVLPLEDLWHLPEILHHETDQHVIDCCFERLERFHREKGKRVLLLIDNLQKVLQQWSEDDHQKLRSFLSRNNFLVIFGSSPSVFREVIDQKAAFHDFFEVRLLAELTNEQVLDLLSRRFREDGRQAEYDARKQELAKKIPAIAVLTGGNPRLVLFLYEIATRSTFLDIEEALRKLIEELREYFVRRFDELPNQARKVLDTVAQMSGPATPKEIAHEARLGLALVNSQLKRLKEGHYVRPIKFQRQKSTRYDITERLFRIWRQTATVAGRQRFRFLADFLKIYFTPEEVRGLYSQHLEYLRNASELPREEVIRHIDELYYFQAAGEAEIRYGAFSSRVEGLARLGELRWAEEEAQYFAAESLRNEDKQGITSAYKQQAMIHTELGRYVDAAIDVEKLVDAGAYQDAAAAAQKLVLVDPASSDAWCHLGVATGNLGNHAKALEAFGKAVEVGQPTAALWSNQAIALSHLKRLNEALKCAERAVAMAPTRSNMWEVLGVVTNARGDHERALAAFRKAAEVGQPTSALWSFQAMALTSLKRSDEALKCWEQAVALDDKNARAWKELGVAVGNLGDHERALSAFRKAAEVGQPTSALWSFQAMALNGLKRPDEALKCVEQALALDEENARVWRQLGLLTYNAGNYGRALAAFRKATEMGQPTSELWSLQAIVLMALKRPEEALKCAEQAVALDDKNARAWEVLGILTHNMHNYERALAAFRKATEAGEPTSGLWSFQAIAFNNLNRPEEALKCAEQAVALDEQNASAWKQLGIAAQTLHQFDRALTAIHKSAETGKTTGELRRLEAKVLRQMGRSQESLAVLDQALVSEADDPDLWRERAWTLLEFSRIDEALECVERARLKGATPGQYHHDRGDLLLLAGRYAEALKDLEAGLKAESDDWDLQTDRLITLGCLGQQGPFMEALPTALARVQIPPTSNVYMYMHDVALNALRRGENPVCLGLLRASLEMKPWTTSDWFGKQLGNFLRRALDTQPQAFIEIVQLVRDRLMDEKVIQLLEPFLKAGEFLQTKNVTILERLFPEVRALVLDIVKRVDPVSYDKFKRLI